MKGDFDHPHINLERVSPESEGVHEQITDGDSRVGRIIKWQRDDNVTHSFLIIFSLSTASSSPFRTYFVARAIEMSVGSDGERRRENQLSREGG